MFKEQHKPTTTPPSSRARARHSRGERAHGKPKAQTVQPATEIQPAYKLRLKLQEMEEAIQHPHLDKKWRKKIASPRAEQIPVQRGRQSLAKEPTKEESSI